jgi:hypothetical protein
MGVYEEEERLPTTKWTKAQLGVFLEKHGITDDVSTTGRTDLYSMAKQINAKKVYVIDNLLKAAGHKVLRLPPYFSIYNLIEHLWGICKCYFDRHVGRGNVWTAGASVKEIMREALATVTPAMWSNCVDHCENQVRKAYEKEVAPIVDIIIVNPIILSLAGDDEDSDNEVSDEEWENVDEEAVDDPGFTFLHHVSALEC